MLQAKVSLLTIILSLKKCNSGYTVLCLKPLAYLQAFTEYLSWTSLSFWVKRFSPWKYFLSAFIFHHETKNIGNCPLTCLIIRPSSSTIKCWMLTGSSSPGFWTKVFSSEDAEDCNWHLPHERQMLLHWTLNKRSCMAKHGFVFLEVWRGYSTSPLCIQEC